MTSINIAQARRFNKPGFNSIKDPPNGALVGAKLVCHLLPTFLAHHSCNYLPFNQQVLNIVPSRFCHLQPAAGHMRLSLGFLYRPTSHRTFTQLDY
jgi:hypothetical protein